jgi:hypothetical protein
MWYLRYLNVITWLLSQWERDEKHPRGDAYASHGLRLNPDEHPIRV